MYCYNGLEFFTYVVASTEEVLKKMQQSNKLVDECLKKS